VVSRTIFVDTEGVRATDFRLGAQARARLFDNGLRAAADFMVGWDHAAWRRTYAAALGPSAA
jgi:hypothetical protein